VGDGFALLTLPAFLPSVTFLFFLPKITGGAGLPAPPLDPPLVLIRVESFTRSAEASTTCRVKFLLEKRLTFIEKAFYSTAWAFLIGGFMGEFREEGSQFQRNVSSAIRERF